MFNRLKNYIRTRIYKGWERADSLIYYAGCYVSIYKNKAYLSHIETDTRVYLLMPRGWFSCEQIWNEINES